LLKKTFNECCKAAFLCGFTKHNMLSTRTEHNFNFSFSSISNPIIRTICSFYRQLFNAEIETVIVQSNKFKKQKIFILKFKKNAIQISEKLNVYNFSKEIFIPTIYGK
jgi:DNA-binding transcriptional regulator WhiA